MRGFFHAESSVEKEIMCMIRSLVFGLCCEFGTLRKIVKGKSPKAKGLSSLIHNHKQLLWSMDADSQSQFDIRSSGWSGYERDDRT